jgi:hypothetical protein
MAYDPCLHGTVFSNPVIHTGGNMTSTCKWVGVLQCVVRCKCCSEDIDVTKINAAAVAILTYTYGLDGI